MIRDAIHTDLARIVEIYNQAIDAKFQTADTEPVTVNDKTPCFDAHLNADYPLIVEERDGIVRGWLSISAYRPGRKALQDCVEISYYVDHSFLRQGIGSALLSKGIEMCKKLNHYSLIAIILDRNEQSIQLMKKFGFSLWAHLPGIANFDGERCGHVYYGMHLK
jgi:L-amino acid N-acyltransferase YncA